MYWLISARWEEHTGHIWLEGDCIGSLVPGELGTHWVHLVEWGMYWLISAGCGGDTLALQVVGDCIGLLCQVSWAHWAHLVGEGLYWLIVERHTLGTSDWRAME